MSHDLTLPGDKALALLSEILRRQSGRTTWWRELTM
jgi:hypothetical protein